MGERKVLNKYIPADFDPSLIPKGKKLSSKDGTVPVRMMLPFSIQCSTCYEFLYRGRKFNSKKEPMGGAEGTYLGITRFRFYIKCTHCSRPITFCTDPKNADYEMESGGTRNYEVYKDKDKHEEDVQAEKEQTEKDDPMKALENRVLESQKEMADLDNLEEIKAMNARHVKLMGKNFEESARAIIEARHGKQTKDDEVEPAEILTAEDEALVQSIQFGKKPKQQIRRLDEEDEQKLEERRQKEAAALQARQQELAQKVAAANSKKSLLPVLKVKRKIATTEDSSNNNNNSSKKVKPTVAGDGLASLLGGYGSDSDDSD